MEFKLTDAQIGLIRLWRRGRIPTVITRVDGRLILLHHWGQGGFKVAEACRKAGRSLFREWYAADVIICCHPQLLPTAVRKKHVFPDHQGRLTCDLYGRTLVIGKE